MNLLSNFIENKFKKRGGEFRVTSTCGFCEVVKLGFNTSYDYDTLVFVNQFENIKHNIFQV